MPFHTNQLINEFQPENRLRNCTWFFKVFLWFTWWLADSSSSLNVRDMTSMRCQASVCEAWVGQLLHNCFSTKILFVFLTLFERCLNFQKRVVVMCIYYIIKLLVVGAYCMKLLNSSQKIYQGTVHGSCCSSLR